MPAPVCNLDCFHCSFPDCINDGAASYDERRELDALEKEIILPKSGKAAKIAAKKKAYYEANREKWRRYYQKRKKKEVV